jgi:hypothetical protein
MQDIQVDALHLQARQRIVQVGADVERRDALAVLVVVRALRHDDDPLAQPALSNPAAQRPLAISTPVDMRRVEGVTSQCEDGIEQGETALQLARVDHDGALRKPRNGLVDAADRTVFHLFRASFAHGKLYHAWLWLVQRPWPCGSYARGSRIPDLHRQPAYTLLTDNGLKE